MLLLITIPILIFLHALSLKISKHRGLKLANFEAMKRVSGKSILSKNIGLVITHITIIILLVLAVAGATYWYSAIASDVDFVIAIDTSTSMLATDLEPNRLEAAKEAAISFVDNLASKGIESNIIIISFSGVAFVEQKLTFDYNEVRNKLKDIEVSDVAGTAIGEAIVTGTNLLSGQSNRTKSIILLTDGQSNVGVDLNKALEYAAEEHIVVNTIGIGTKTGAKFHDSSITSQLDEESLKNIANVTGGRYYLANDKEAFIQAFSSLAEHAESKIGVKLTPYLLTIAVIILLLEWFSRTLYRVIP